MSNSEKPKRFKRSKKMTIRNLTRLCYLSVLILGVSVVCRLFRSHVLYSISVVWEFLSYIVYTVMASGEVQAALISGVFLLVAAYLAYKYGLQTYYIKREHEQVRARYLDGGIDSALKIFDEIKAILLSNILVVQSDIYAFKINENIDFLYKLKGAPLLPIKHATVIRRVTRLLGDSIVYDCIGSWLGTTRNQIDFFDRTFREILLGAKKEIPKLDEKGKASCFNYLEQKLDEQFKLSNIYDFVTEHLDAVITILEREALTWKQVPEFRDRDEVKQIVTLMKADYQKAIEYEENLFGK